MYRKVSHQEKVIENILNILKDVEIKNRLLHNRNGEIIYDEIMYNNILQIFEENRLNIDNLKNKNKILKNFTLNNFINQLQRNNLDYRTFDISMPTGTGKTFTIVKSILELNKLNNNLNKFIIIVPNLVIKQTFINLFKSDSFNEFISKNDYNNLNLFIAESRSKKDINYTDIIYNFITDTSLNVNILLINQQLLTKIKGDTLLENKGIALDDLLTLLTEIKSIIFVDEAHRFTDSDNYNIPEKTIKIIKTINPQLMFRFGATFKDIKIPIYWMTYYEAYKNNLVKHVKFRPLSLDNREINIQDLSSQQLENIYSRIIDEHFKLELDLLNRNSDSSKIKPFTLIRIKEQKDYINNSEFITMLTKLLENKITDILNNNKNLLPSYRKYLEESLKNINYVYGTHLSDLKNTKINKSIELEKAEFIKNNPKELIKINLDSPLRYLRFIFTVNALAEGWDLPNIFIILKLYKDNQETRPIQLVGRGSRLPLNIFGKVILNKTLYPSLRVFYNNKENIMQEIKNTILSEQINYIINKDNNKIEHAVNNMLENNDVVVRKTKYNEFKPLWNNIKHNKILDYEYNKDVFFNIINNNLNIFNEYIKSLYIGIEIKTYTLNIVDNNVDLIENDTKEILKLNALENYSTMSYYDYINRLENATLISKTLTLTLKDSIDDKFNKNINSKSLNKNIELYKYIMMKYIENLDDSVLKYISLDDLNTEFETILDRETLPSNILGIKFDNRIPPEEYLYDKIYYDSELELNNILTTINDNVKRIVVFAKLPKDSVKIPLPNGHSYSPDFGYIIEYNDNKKEIHLIIETKNIKNDMQLREIEQIKINLARKFFEDLKKNIDNENIEIIFKVQTENIAGIINNIN